MTVHPEWRPAAALFGELPPARPPQPAPPPRRARDEPAGDDSPPTTAQRLAERQLEQARRRVVDLRSSEPAPADDEIEAAEVALAHAARAFTAALGVNVGRRR